MVRTKLQKGEIYEFPVKRKQTENYKTYYIIVAEGREYAIRLFEVQREEPLPKTLSCVVNDIRDGVPVIQQNTGALLHRLYEVGEVYSFWVRNDYTNMPLPYYELADWNGLYFRLMHYGNARLSIHQRVTCVVRNLKGHKLTLELLQDVEKDIPEFWLPEELLEAIDASDYFVRWVKRLLQKLPEFAETREAFAHGDSEWLLMAVNALDATILEWLKPEGKHARILLDYYRRACLYLLEDSDYISGCSQRREAYQKQLVQAVENADVYKKALDLIAGREHVMYIDRILTKIKKSGFLYQAESHFRILVCLFSLDRELMHTKIRTILNILIEGDPKVWQTETFCGPLLDLLELYVSKYKDITQRVAFTEQPEARQYVSNMIMALAFEQLLVTDKAAFDRRLNRAMLYRYLTFVKGGDSAVLLEKAFRCLTDVRQEQLEYGWSDVRDITLLVLKLSCAGGRDSAGAVAVSQNYEGRDVRLCIMNDVVQLMPLQSAKNLKNVLLDQLLPWRQFRVMLDKGILGNFCLDKKDVIAYYQMWTEIEYSLFHSPNVMPSQKKRHKVLPEPGDEVVIRVLEQDIINADYFHCRLEDDTYRGKGTLCLRNVVRYGLRVGVDAFCSGKGKPYLLKAEVQGVNEKGECVFSLLDTLAQFVRQAVNVGDGVLCKVTEFMNGSYYCISDYGYSLLVGRTKDMPDLKSGDYIEVKVSEIKVNGTVQAYFVKQVIANFTVSDVFADLIASYAGDCVYEEEEVDKEDSSTEAMLEDSYMMELIYIIDSVGMLEKDRKDTYNYLAMARIMALLSGQDDMADYYAEHMKFIRMLQQFAINGRLDMEQLQEQESVDENLLRNYPLLQTLLAEVRVVGCLDRPEKNEYLWNVSRAEEYKQLSGLAQLVLAYNMLENFNLSAHQSEIRKKMMEQLHLDIDVPVVYSFGQESQHVEFKTSIVYPPKNGMRPFLTKQTQEVMQVICGFLNAEGGTLYLGVNNQGAAEGLSDDIAYFQDSKDKFDLHVRNSIVASMGLEANAGISASYLQAGDRLAYALNIKPCPHPVKCNGIYYQRQGTSTWVLQGDALEAFIGSRSEEEKAVVPAGFPIASPIELPAGTSVEETLAEEVEPIFQIATDQLRSNVVHSYEEGYGENTIVYLHLLESNNYMITHDESWRNDIMLSLAIHDDEKDGYLVIVYESGRVLKVLINELLGRIENHEYKRFAQEKVPFACPAAKGTGVLLVLNDMQGKPVFRLEDLSCIKESNMLSKGEFTTHVQFAGVLQCGLIPAADREKFKRISDQKSTYLGPNLMTEWGIPEREEFRKMGFRLMFE